MQPCPSANPQSRLHRASCAKNTLRPETQFRQVCAAGMPGIAREGFHNGEYLPLTSKKAAAKPFAPARSCIRKRRKDDRSAGARTAADEAFALGALASQLANATNSFSLFTRTLLRRLF